MSTIYVWSGATGAANGTSWTDAYTSLVTGLDNASAGDTINLASDHDESVGATSVTFASPGTLSSPVIIRSLDRSDDSYLKAPSDQLGQSSGFNDVTLSGVCFAYGLNLDVADDLLVSNSAYWELEDCTVSVGTSSSPYIGKSGSEWILVFRECSVTWDEAVSVYFDLSFRCVLHFIGGSVTAPSTSGVLATTSESAAHIVFDSVDLSGFDGDLISIGDSIHCLAEFRNCALNASSSLLSGSLANADSVVRMDVSDSASTVYRTEQQYYRGDVVQSTAIYRDSGASDGTTNYSWQVTSNANVRRFSTPLRIKLVDVWTDTSTTKTFTVHVAQDGTDVALNDDECWVEIVYPDGSTAQGVVETDRTGDVATTPAAQADSTEAWTGLGATNKKQKLAVTTSQTGKAGPTQVYVCLAKPSTAVFVDPKVEVA